MTTKVLALLTLMLAASAAHAVRVIEQPERPYEISLPQLTLPSGTSGALTVKACDDCPYRSHVLTSSTEFYVNNQLVSFAEFGRVADELRGLGRAAAEATLVGVFVDVESGRVNRVKLRARRL